MATVPPICRGTWYNISDCWREVLDHGLYRVLCTWYLQERLACLLANHIARVMYRFGARSSVIHDLSVLEKGNPPPHKKKDLQTEGPARNSVFLWNNTKNPIVRYLTHPVQHVYCLQRFEGRQDFWIGSVLFPGVVIISSC